MRRRLTALTSHRRNDERPSELEAIRGVRGTADQTRDAVETALN